MLLLSYFILYSFASYSIFKVNCLIEHLEGYSLDIFLRGKNNPVCKQMK